MGRLCVYLVNSRVCIIMKKSDNTKRVACILFVCGLMICPGRVWAANTDEANETKKVLAILGDAHHPVFPQYAAIVRELQRKGYEADVILDYNVPFDRLSDYGIVLLSRYAYNDILLCERHRFNFAKGKDHHWLTADEEESFEKYVNAGGRLFLHHDGIGFYLKDRAISRLAKAHFVTHPPIVNIKIRPTGKLPELTKGVESFEVEDEEYVLEMDESQTNVFLESHSETNGRFAQGWAHEYGKGKVAVLIPGHEKKVLYHPMVKQCIINVIEWLEKE